MTTSEDESPEPVNPTKPTRSFWQRWALDPITRQLTQGVTPGRITFTLAIGSVCALFPFLGFTWLLNLVVGVVLRLNQPILQTYNQLLTPIHLPMIVVYVRGGEWMWGADEEVFSVTEMIRNFAELSFLNFLQKFGWAGIHAFTAWITTAPLLLVVVFYAARPLVNRMARLRAKAPVPVS